MPLAGMQLPQSRLERFPTASQVGSNKRFIEIDIILGKPEKYSYYFPTLGLGQFGKIINYTFHFHHKRKAKETRKQNKRGLQKKKLRQRFGIPLLVASCEEQTIIYIRRPHPTRTLTHERDNDGDEENGCTRMMAMMMMMMMIMKMRRYLSEIGIHRAQSADHDPPSGGRVGRLCKKKSTQRFRKK